MNTTRQIQAMVALVVLLAVGLLAYTVWEPTRQIDAEERQLETSVEYGAELFANNCAVCHGLRGEGFVGPALDTPANRPTDAAELTKLQDKFKNTIECGRVGTFMPAWAQAQGGAFNGEQVRQLVLLITTNAGEGWEQVAELSAELEIETAQPTADQINQGACGQIYKPAPTPTGPPPPAQDAWDVAMKDNFFDPTRITVTAGQAATISLTNEGSAIHNMRIAGADGQYETADDAVSNPDTVRAATAATLSFTPDAAGTLAFRCDFHPVEMVGTITVQ